MKYKKRFLVKLLICFIIINTIQSVFLCFFEIKFAKEDDETEKIIKSQVKTLNVNDFINQAEQYANNNDDFKLDLNSIFVNAVKGNIDNKDFLQDIISIIFKQGIKTIYVVATIIVIVILSSFLKSITDGLENNGISQIVYYVTYILIITIVMKNFSDIICMVKLSIEKLVGFSNSLLPILITLMLTTGNVTSASMLEPIILFLITFISNIINNMLIPFILISLSLNMISNLSSKVQVEKLSKFIHSSVIWFLGILLTGFVTVASLEGNLTGSIDAVTVKTTKAAVSNFIPVVGKILR